MLRRSAPTKLIIVKSSVAIGKKCQMFSYLKLSLNNPKHYLLEKDL